MKSTELLQKQHSDIEAILDRLHTATLVAHTKIEEELFYPAVRSILPLETMEALEEHGLVDVQLARLLADAATGDVSFEAKAAVLAEIVVRHIRREESEILKLAERELGDEQLHAIGERMGPRFRQVVESGFQKPLQKALLAELPRTPSRARRAKKTTRRAPAKTAKGSRREAAPARAKRRAASTRAGKSGPATKRTPRQTAAVTRKPAEKPARAARARRAPARGARSRA